MVMRGWAECSGERDIGGYDVEFEFVAFNDNNMIADLRCSGPRVHGAHLCDLLCEGGVHAHGKMGG